MTVAGALDWTPPVGMVPEVAAGWRAFYRQAMAEYGVTPQDYRLLYIAQKGRCWICRTAKGKHPDDPKGAGSRRLGIDHNHALGNTRQAVRGLLCSGGERTCNRILGHLRDSPAAFKRAEGYLVQPPAQRLFWELREQEQDANEAGIVLSPVDLERLAVRILWPQDET